MSFSHRRNIIFQLNFEKRHMVPRISHMTLIISHINLNKEKENLFYFKEVFNLGILFYLRSRCIFLINKITVRGEQITG